MNNFVCAGASSDPPPAGTPFVLDREPCAEPYVRGYVMARFEGSGRLARIWLTAASIRRAPPDRELVRIYVDEKTTPVIQLPLSKMLDGSAGEIFGRPFGAGSGRRLAWYYPLVFSSKLMVTLDRLDPKDLYYHQTAVVLDGQRVERRAPEQRLPQRDRAVQLLRSGPSVQGERRSERLQLVPGQPVTAFELRGPATVARVRLAVADQRLAQLDQVRLRVRWDDDVAPAMDLPLSHLFAAWHSVPGRGSLALGASAAGDRTVFELRLPMPFRDRATWRLHNEGREPVEMELELRVRPGVPVEPWGTLRVQEFDSRPPAPQAHRLVAAEGRGRLVGVCMMLHGGAAKLKGMRGHPMNFLEGDELGTIDGERALAGTGTEDYFNGAFYFEEGASADPFAQIWGIVRHEPSPPRSARVTACRWHVLGDAIDFERSLELQMEVGPGDPSSLRRYQSVAYLYQ